MILTARRSLVSKMSRNQPPRLELFFLNIHVRRSHLVLDSLNEVQNHLFKKLMNASALPSVLTSPITAKSIKEISLLGGGRTILPSVRADWSQSRLLLAMFVVISRFCVCTSVVYIYIYIQRERVRERGRHDDEYWDEQSSESYRSACRPVRMRAKGISTTSSFWRTGGEVGWWVEGL